MPRLGTMSRAASNYSSSDVYIDEFDDTYTHFLIYIILSLHILNVCSSRFLFRLLRTI